MFKLIGAGGLIAATVKACVESSGGFTGEGKTRCEEEREREDRCLIVLVKYRKLLGSSVFLK